MKVRVISMIITAMTKMKEDKYYEVATFFFFFFVVN
jgi:hypothetical protein